MSQVASITIFRPSRFSLLKLFFTFCCLVAGGLIGLFFFTPLTVSIPVGVAIGLIVGLLVFIPARPTALMILASDGSGAVFPSRDETFLRNCKSFLDAKINESRLDATGFFDFEAGRFEPLAEGDGRGPSMQTGPVPPAAGQARPDAPLAAGTPQQQRRDPQQRQEPALNAPSEQPTESPADHPVKGPEPAPTPEVAPVNEGGVVPAPPQNGQDPRLPVQNDGYDALRNALSSAASPEPPVAEPAVVPQRTSQPLPPIDFGNAMAQVQQVRRFYEETVQNPAMVKRLDVMVEIMHSGAGNERDRADLVLIAEEIESNLSTYPSIAAIFRAVADQARTAPVA